MLYWLTFLQRSNVSSTPGWLSLSCYRHYWKSFLPTSDQYVSIYIVYRQSSTKILSNHSKFEFSPLSEKYLSGFHIIVNFKGDILLAQVNTQLYSSKEKRQLSDLVNTMIACNLTYKQEKAPDGQYVYTLEP